MTIAVGVVAAAGEEDFAGFVLVEVLELVLEYADSVLLQQEQARSEDHEAPADVEGWVGADQRCESWAAVGPVFDCGERLGTAGEMEKIAGSGKRTLLCLNRALRWLERACPADESPEPNAFGPEKLDHHFIPLRFRRC